MAWVTPYEFSAFEVLTASMMNAIQDNMNATAVAKVTTAGDMVRATGANALERFAIASIEGQVLTRVSGVPAWAAGGKLTAVRVYTANNTWTKPAGLRHIIAIVVGGGGGGGGGNTGASQTACAGGGGGGGFAQEFLLAAALGATEAVTVGAAGAAGSAPPGRR